MSQAQEFMERVKSDTALREQVMGLGQDMQGVLDLAKREGYNFTQADFLAALKERGYEVGMELTEEDLAEVTGGATSGAFCNLATSGTDCSGTSTNWPQC